MRPSTVTRTATGKDLPHVTRRPARLLVAAAAVLALAACGSPVRSGAAAVVGDQRVTDTQLQQVVQRGLADPQAAQQAGADRPAYQRSVLRRLIEHMIVAKAAANEHVSVSPGQVDATTAAIAKQIGGTARLKAEAAKAGVAPADLRQTLSDIALRDALAEKLSASVVLPQAALQQAYAKKIAMYDQVRSAHILVATLPQAKTILAAVKAHPAQFAALAKRYSIDTGSKANGGDLGFQGRGALAKPFETAIFAAKPGSFVLARTQFGYHVIHVIARRTTTLAQATPALRKMLLAQQGGALVGKLLQDTSRRLGVKVNPRFGVWDPTALDVVAAKANPGSDVSTPTPTPGGAGGAPAPGGGAPGGGAPASGGG